MKKVLIIIFALLFFLCNIQSINTFEINKNILSKFSRVDTSLYLSEEQLTLLKKILEPYDTRIEMLMNKTNPFIEKNGTVDSRDFEKINKSLNTGNMSVYFSHIVFCTDFNENNFHFLPGKIFINNQGHYFGYAPYITVEDTNHFYVWRIRGLQNISNNHLYKNVDVIGIGFVGSISDHGGPFSNYGWNFIGKATLWIVL
jgi:hypothetical protein